MNDKAMKYIIALLSSLILTSCSMFNNEAPYKRFFSEKEYPIIKAIHDCDKDKILDVHVKRLQRKCMYLSKEKFIQNKK